MKPTQSGAHQFACCVAAKGDNHESVEWQSSRSHWGVKRNWRRDRKGFSSARSFRSCELFDQQRRRHKVVAEIGKAGGKAIAVGGSVAKPEDIDRIFAETKKAYGRVDILVNNAGVYAFSPIETLTTESINALFSVNVFGLLLATKAALPLFTEEGGSIINIGSVIGEMAPAQASIYAGTKGALNSISRVFAKELAPKKIRVNAVNPGAVHTEGFESAGFKDSPMEAHMDQNTPLGRLGMPRTSRTWLRILHRRSLVGLLAH